MNVVREVAANTFEVVPFGATVLHEGVMHPWQVIELWSDAELASIDVYRVVSVDVPPGKRLIEQTFTRNDDGVVIAVGVFEDLDPPSPALTRRQVILGLRADGFISTEEAVASATGGAEPAAIAAIFDAQIADPEQRADATITWASMRDALRTDPLTHMLQRSRGMTDAEVDAMWLRWSVL